ncbi:MAG TPA: nuclear transport factor 2 family protein [Cellvibrio sp.]|nr:nuclear transport factor 2 family protein [Cellvibrio sp.]
MHAKIMELEEQLRLAMCTSNVDELEKLLAPNLVFTNHLGVRITKQQDIEAHISKVFVIESILLSNPRIIDLGNSAVVSVQADIRGFHEGKAASGRFCFTRVWANNAGVWQVVAGHSCLIS